MKRRASNSQNTTLALRFALMSADEQRQCVQRMSADGMSDRGIGELTGLSVEMVRHLIDAAPCARFEDYENQRRLDDECSVASPFRGTQIPRKYD